MERERLLAINKEEYADTFEKFLEYVDEEEINKYDS